MRRARCHATIALAAAAGSALFATPRAVLAQDGTRGGAPPAPQAPDDSRPAAAAWSPGDLVALARVIVRAQVVRFTIRGSAVVRILETWRGDLAPGLHFLVRPALPRDAEGEPVRPRDILEVGREYVLFLGASQHMVAREGVLPVSDGTVPTLSGEAGGPRPLARAREEVLAIEAAGAPPSPDAAAALAADDARAETFRSALREREAGSVADGVSVRLIVPRDRIGPDGHVEGAIELENRATEARQVPLIALNARSARIVVWDHDEPTEVPPAGASSVGSVILAPGESLLGGIRFDVPSDGPVPPGRYRLQAFVGRSASPAVLVTVSE